MVGPYDRIEKFVGEGNSYGAWRKGLEKVLVWFDNPCSDRKKLFKMTILGVWNFDFMSSMMINYTVLVIAQIHDMYANYG